MNRIFPGLFSLFLLLFALDAAENDQPPNFIIIFCDDMAYADIGPFGAAAGTTPNLDRMAREGMKFTDFYVGRSFCSPSRAALLTGCIPTRVGVGGNFSPQRKNGLNPEETTIAEVLQERDYATAIFGKWHLGNLPKFLPTNQGFDEYFGLPYSNDMWPLHPEFPERYPDLPLLEGTRVIKPKITPEDQVKLTTWYTNRAVSFIEKNPVRPFLLYLPHAMPHVPLYASEKYRNKTRRGLYADVIAEIDWSVGQILDALKRTDLDKRTLVVFTSDNGPWLLYGDHAGSAGPLREGKGSNFEGGFRVPCIMRWPGRIPIDSVCREVAGTIDLLPTLARLADAPLPSKKIDGKNILPLMEGRPEAKSPHEVSYHYNGANRLVALRSGKWKLMFPQTYNSPEQGRGGNPGKRNRKHIELSLFDLEKDIGETTNEAEKNPEIVERLKKLADTMRKDLGDGKQTGPGRRLLGQ